jgi:hypothetical protein
MIRAIGFIFLMALFTGCKEAHRTQKVPIGETVAQTPQKKLATNKDSILVGSLEYFWSDNESSQKIKLLAMDSLTVRYYIDSRTSPCDTEYWGTAKRMANVDPETDSDDDGGYMSLEFIKEDKQYTLFLRMAEDSSKVIIKYNDKSLGTDCAPIPGQIMRKKE